MYPWADVLSQDFTSRLENKLAGVPQSGEVGLLASDGTKKEDALEIEYVSWPGSILHSPCRSHRIRPIGDRNLTVTCRTLKASSAK